MPDSVQINPVRYSAFLSYSHRDAAFARRLQRQLETYRLPAQLRGNPMLAAGETSRLKPIFRDRDELAAAADLPGAVREAIEASGHMIVICSASSAGSAWVKREVALFREIHGDHAILAAVCETIAPDIAPLILNAMFPEHDGPQPLAAHFNRHGDGARLALLKLVAALAGVRLDELAQRDAQRRVHQVTRLGIGALAGMAIMAGLAVVAINERATAERERARGEKLIAFLLTNLRSELKGFGRLALLDKVNAGVGEYFQYQDISGLSDGELVQRAQLLRAAGDDDAMRRNFDQARALYDEAARTTSAVLIAHPNDQERIFAHSQSEFAVGFVNWRLNNYGAAELGFQEYAALTQRLVEMAPSNAQWLKESGDADLNLGMFIMRQHNDLTRARNYFIAALVAYSSASKMRPNDAEVQTGLVDAYAYLADVERERGDFADARSQREKSSALLNSRLLGDPSNAETQTAIVSNTLGLARIDIARGQVNKGLAELEDGRTNAQNLADADKANIDIRAEARAFDLFEARAWMALAPDKRPEEARISAAIGNCDDDQTKIRSRELAMFCRVLHVTDVAENGRYDVAKKLIAALRIDLKPDHGKRSERWGVNFDQELEIANAAINVGERK
jgi:tetratricopeptide (TPR) repeat protein